jgi:hypothetical protein
MISPTSVPVDSAISASHSVHSAMVVSSVVRQCREGG